MWRPSWARGAQRPLLAPGGARRSPVRPHSGLKPRAVCSLFQGGVRLGRVLQPSKGLFSSPRFLSTKIQCRTLCVSHPGFTSSSQVGRFCISSSSDFILQFNFPFFLCFWQHPHPIALCISPNPAGLWEKVKGSIASSDGQTCVRWLFSSAPPRTG